MKQWFIRKTAILMCTVMLFSSLSINMGVFAADEEKNAVIATPIVGNSSQVTDETETEQDSSLIETLKTIVEVVKKVIASISAYLEEQEQIQQEQEKAEESETDLSKTGVVGYLFDPEEKCFYTASDPWQRVVGYNELFDVFSEVALIDFDTVRFKFDYKKKNWLIQVWKGQYGLLFYGAEIGLYNKPADRKIAHYDAVEDYERLKMSMDFYEYEKGFFTKAEWKKKFSRPYEYYWWCTGFIPGNRNDEFDKLRVDARITAKDYDMLSGITQAIKNAGLTCKVNGLDVTFTYQ